MTHQKTAGHAPALGVVRPVFSIDTTGQVTLEPCTKCKQTAVCLPVAGRHGRRAYPYCVETCWPLARAASETVVKVEQARRPLMRCSCCGEFGHVRPVILSGDRLTSLVFCERACWSDRLATLEQVPTCGQCGRYLQPNEYVNGKCGVCK